LTNVLRPLITSLFLLLASASLAGPIVPSRSFILAPKMREVTDTTKGVKFLRQNGLWGNLARGFKSTDDRFAWSVSFGGIIGFAEWDNSSLYLQGDAEVLADTYNDISFNPRSIFWTEGIVYGLRLDSTNELHLGYIHRCKHDIDNLGSNKVAANEERTLIYGSLMGKYVARDFYIFDYNTSTSAQLDMYLVKQDYRIPVERTGYPPSVENLNMSLELAGKFDMREIFDVLNPYIRLQYKFASYNWFDIITVDTRFEIGFELKGETTTMDVFYGFEYLLNDDMNRPSPVPSNYWYLGFRFIPNNIGL
jgi:hypothetical protein